MTFTPRTPRVVAARRLQRRRDRDDTGRFLAEGPQAVRAALTAGVVVELFGTPQAFSRYADLVAQAPSASPVTDDAMAALAETVHPQGLIAVCEQVDVPLAGALAKRPRLVAVAAEIRDPGNAGTVLRTADAAGAGAVVFAGEAVDPYNGKCVRSSAGSLFNVDVVRTPLDVVGELRAAGLQVLATSGYGADDLDTLLDDGVLAAPTAWLFGSEAHGLPDALLAAADRRVRVPIYGGAESLNLAAAAAVCPVRVRAGAPLMRALVYDAVGAPIVPRDVPDPSCPPDGAVVEVRATGVCRSDWHAWRGHDPVALPHVPGHEFAGVVAAVGPRVTGFAVGERVTAPFVNGCGTCSYCRSGAAQVCPDQTQPGFTHWGSFAERVVVRAADTNLVRLPPGVDFASAAALGCRFATAYRALTGHGPLAPDATVAVFGCGGVGLSVIMVAVAFGARVLAVDPSPAALELAAALGASPLSPSGGMVLDQVAHVAVDAYGSAATAEASVRSLRRGGRHVQVGLMLGADARAALPWDLVVARELHVAGSHGMAAAGYPAMLEFVGSGRLSLERLIGERVPLAAAGAALMAMDERVAPRAGITVAVAD